MVDATSTDVVSSFTDTCQHRGSLLTALVSRVMRSVVSVLSSVSPTLAFEPSDIYLIFSCVYSTGIKSQDHRSRSSVRVMNVL